MSDIKAAFLTPSGLEVTPIEVIHDQPGPDGLVTRFRFLAPAIAREGGGVDFDTASHDMAWLCAHYAQSRLDAATSQAAQVIISLSDRPVPFGEADPEATQFFEAYRIEDGICVLELF